MGGNFYLQRFLFVFSRCDRKNSGTRCFEDFFRGMVLDLIATVIWRGPLLADQPWHEGRWWEGESAAKEGRDGVGI